MIDPGDDQSLTNLFRQAAVWVAAATIGLPVYFLIAWDPPRILASLIAAFVALVLLALVRHAPALRDHARVPATAESGPEKHTTAPLWPVQRDTSRTAYYAANGLTFVRPGIGVAAGIAVAAGELPLGFCLFFLGLTSDVLDGMIARVFGVESADGREWDAIADVIHNFSFGVGLAWNATRPILDPPTLVALLAIVLLFSASRFVVRVHSVADKCLSALWRVTLFLLTYRLLPPDWRLAALFGGVVLAALGGIYEVGVLRAEVRRGARRWY